jgi:hypothetical protein
LFRVDSSIEKDGVSSVIICKGIIIFEIKIKKHMVLFLNFLLILEKIILQECHYIKRVSLVCVVLMKDFSCKIYVCDNWRVCIRVSSDLCTHIISFYFY